MRGSEVPSESLGKTTETDLRMTVRCARPIGVHLCGAGNPKQGHPGRTWGRETRVARLTGRPDGTRVSRRQELHLTAGTTASGRQRGCRGL